MGRTIEVETRLDARLDLPNAPERVEREREDDGPFEERELGEEGGDAELEKAGPGGGARLQLDEVASG